MKKPEGRLVGILGTVILHLIAGIIFMTFQIRSLQKERKEIFQVEFQNENEVTQQEQELKLPVTTSGEKIQQEEEKMQNIARNLANKSDEKINASDYIDKVKDELIKSGKLGVDNYIDEQKRKAQNKGDEDIAVEDSSKNEKNEKPTESQVMASNFKGPTRIYYDLTGRTHTYLPLPIYMCQSSGKVVLSIDVNQKGDVERAQVISAQSTTTDPCLIETAISTALESRFNAEIKSPKIQTGTLTYLFVAQ